MRNFLNIVERDLKRLWSYKIFIFTNALTFLVQIFIYALILNFLVTGFDYTQFYAAGVAVLTLWSFGMWTAWEIADERSEGVIDYHLTLPFSRTEYVLGRMVGGTLRTMIYSIPLFIIFLFVTGIGSILNLLIVFGLLFLFAFGVTSLGVIIGSFTKEHVKLSFILGLIDAFLIRLSTIYYPIYAMDYWMRFVSVVNPLSYAADATRWGLGLPADSPILISVVFVVIFSLILVGVAIRVYSKRLEGGLAT
ncbi:MAG: ABC transporter permease [Candidatus Helarchaeota archaeon]|nr:ABC transporter permease [Candidatus Helarchaeota archaeon]